MDRKYRILIVDDENEILATYRDFFVKRGFEVEIAHDGVEGLDKLRKAQFDVAIVDMKMPKMGGIAMIKKATDEGIDVDMVILTGHGGKEEAVAAINLGVSAWFEKQGIRMAELLSTVKELAEGVPIKEIHKLLAMIPEKGYKDTND
jgi:DNA-binding NtrC family response regulator